MQSRPLLINGSTNMLYIDLPIYHPGPAARYDIKLFQFTPEHPILHRCQLDFVPSLRAKINFGKGTQNQNQA